jgi:hypothetical protein
VAAARLGGSREQPLVTGLLLELGAVLFGQGLAEAGVLVVHAVLPFWVSRPGHLVARHGPAGLPGHGCPTGGLNCIGRVGGGAG